MTYFYLIALILTTTWLVLVAVRFHHSTIVLVAGLVTIGLYTLAALVLQQVTLNELGLGTDRAWLPATGLTLAWLVLLILYSPLADWLATRWYGQAPMLDAFRVIQQSKKKLILGIVMAWVLGGILEELIFKGIVLSALESWLRTRLGVLPAAGIAISFAALGAGIIHLYQGSRAVVIITQLSVLFGILYVVSRHNLWAVMVCHGLFDTIAFVRFATRRSRYSNLDNDRMSSSNT